MSSLRSGTPGATRVCPHCKATVLETAAICPGCRHHLRFSTDAAQAGADEGYCALSVDGSIAHKVTTEPCEYFVVLDIRNERGEQLARQVVGVGVLQPGEVRRLNVSVGMRPVRAQQPAVKPQPSASSSSHSGAKPSAAVVRPPVAATAAVESRLQPRPTGKPTGAGTTGGATPRFRNFHKP
jgi:hypothetical protein